MRYNTWVFAPPNGRRRPCIGPAALAAPILTLTVMLAACGSGPVTPSPAPPSTPATTSAVVTGSPSPLHTTAPSPSLTSAPSPSPTTASTTGVTTSPVSPSPVSPSPSAPPDPRSQALGPLLRPGTTPETVAYGDLDGDGVEDIALLQVAKHPPPGGVMAQEFLDVFTWDGSGWTRTWEATGPAPPGVSGEPASVLNAPGDGVPDQVVDFLHVVDMAGDGTADLAVGVTNYGAGPGPMDVWVIGFGGGTPSTEFWEETQQDGTLLPDGAALRLQTPKFAPGDPACCPSGIEHQTIGFDPGTNGIGVLQSSVTPVH